jgi:hypothetical protein
MPTHIITLEICHQGDGEPPQVRTSSSGAELLANTDEALVARVMLQSAAYLFAQGQRVSFGREIPLELLK